MHVGLVGLSLSGKSTLFHALLGQRAGDAGAGAVKANVGVAHIPDPRLDLIASRVPTQKVVPTSLHVVDAPGLTPGDASAAGRALSHVREVDALCHVVRCFDPGGQPPAPGKDIAAFESELILADMQTVESALPRAERNAKSKEKLAVQRLETLRAVAPVLEDGRPLRAMIAQDELPPQQMAIVRELGLLSAKKVLYVANLDENDLGGGGEAAQTVRDAASEQGMEAIALCAPIEAELVQLDESDRREMLEGLGLTEPALPALARALHRLLDLQSFYTAGPKEVRAWTVRRGATAPEAAGVVHSDMQRGFIRAEIYSVNDLAELGSEKAIKEAGRLRVEGKHYTMRDGDVAHFLFNV